MDHPFTDNQRRVIDDLSTLEVNATSVEEQLMFSLYYEKYVKLMLRYHLAGNTRSKQAVEAVMKVLKNQEFDAMGQVKGSQLSTTQIIIKKIQQLPLWLIGVVFTVGVVFVAFVFHTLYIRMFGFRCTNVTTADVGV